MHYSFFLIVYCERFKLLSENDLTAFPVLRDQRQKPTLSDPVGADRFLTTFYFQICGWLITSSVSLPHATGQLAS